MSYLGTRTPLVLVLISPFTRVKSDNLDPFQESLEQFIVLTLSELNLIRVLCG